MEISLTKFALSTRIFIIILQYLSNIIIPDHEADAFVSPSINNNYSTGDKIIRHFLGGFVRWDAQYFMHIARYGYTYENALAFFPLYPLITRLITLVIYNIFPWINFDTILLFVFIALNIILFVLSAKVLFQLTTIIFDENVAYKSTLLFCFNPASVFFSAPYSECLFCYLTLHSILNCVILYKKYSNTKYYVNYCDILYVLPICLSAIVRSNGILNIGFLAYTLLCLFLKNWPKDNFVKKVKFIIITLLFISILTIICLIPFTIYQIYCYQMFCTNFKKELRLDIVAYAKSNDLVLPGQFSKYNQTWCYNKIPMAYSYVQNHYWKVGFLNYYELKQFPNFLLAAPVLIILIKSSCEHIAANISKDIIDIFSFNKLSNKKRELDILFNPIKNVFVIHILFLSLFCLFCVHIQVSTRMLCSASPILYWICANYFNDKYLNNFSDVFHKKMTVKEYTIVIYFLSYFFIGTVLFCNFLPWT